MGPELERALTFVCGLGLPTQHGRPNNEPAFFPDAYVWVWDGVLHWDERSHPGDLLHEAGHLAVLPSFARQLVRGDAECEAVQEALHTYLTSVPDLFSYPEDAQARACLQSGDSEAIAWSYAAAVACGVDPWLCFEHGFEDPEEAFSMYELTQIGKTEGVAGLRAAGFLGPRGMGTRWPTMARWLAP